MLKLLHFLLCIIVLAVLFSCHGNEEGTRMDVMVVWTTDETDPTYQQWIPQVEQEIQSLADQVVLHPAYIKLGKQRRFQSVEEFHNLVQGLDQEGHKPGLILLHGAYSEMMFWDSQQDSIFKDIPIVAFGLHLNRFSIPQIEAQRLSGIHSHPLYAEIFDTLDLKSNLDMAARLFPNKKRFVSNLDRWSRFVDICQTALLRKQLAAMDSTRYVDNMDLHITEDSLPRITDRIVYQSLSHLYPESNIQPADSAIFSVSTALNSHLSCMHYIQLAHDDVTRQITETTDRVPYLTMTAEDFLVNDNCIGGYFAPFETQIKDAVVAARELLASQGDTLHIERHHQKEYLINWNALRSSLTPEVDGVESRFFHPQEMAEIKLYNTNLLDNYPEYRTVLLGFICLLLLISAVSAVWACVSAYKKHDRMAQKARETARQAEVERNVIQQILAATDSFQWEEADHFFDEPHFVANEFFRQQLTDFLANSTPGTYELQVRASISGHQQQWYGVIMMVSQSKGLLVRSGYVVNIDKLKSMEAEILDVDRMLKLAQDRKEFLASMSHLMRAPLNVIVGFSQIVGSPDSDLSDEELATFQKVIAENNIELTHIINNLLTHTLMGNSNMRLNMQPIRVADFLQGEDFWDYASHALESRQCNLVVEPNAANPVMMCDKLGLTLVINHLVDNAAKYSPEGSTVTVGWTMDEDFVTIHVRDHGMGISPEHQQLVFEHFFKVDYFSSGTGLGLSISRNWIELMGGAIGLESELGKGSHFWVKLQRDSQHEK